MKSIMYVALAFLIIGLVTALNAEVKKGKELSPKIKIVYSIVCERNNVEKVFSITSLINIDKYEREFMFRSACEMISNDSLLWENDNE